MSKFLHLTNHRGTIKSINSVFKYLNMEERLVTRNVYDHYFIDSNMAHEIFNNHKTLIKDYDYLIFTDTSMLARPFLQYLEDHNCKIIMYITNRFDWGMFGFRDEKYYKLYSDVSKTQRVFFCTDNEFDYWHASSNGIKLINENAIKLTLPLCQNIILPSSENKDKLFIFDRGTNYSNLLSILNQQNIKYDIFGERHKPYRDVDHICEYIGILHLPYQVNIQSLWENLAYNIIYFIPSKKFIKELIEKVDWYYWEESKFSKDREEKSINLSEWYLPENECLFEYFDNWNDLKNKLDIIDEDYLLYKKTIIKNFMENSNKQNIDKWRKIISYNLNLNILCNEYSMYNNIHNSINSINSINGISNIKYNRLPTIVTMFYDIRKKERSMPEHNRQQNTYYNLASNFLLKLPYPLIIFMDENDYDLIDFIITNRTGKESITYIYPYRFAKTYFYKYVKKLKQIQQNYKIYNGSETHETTYYITLTNNKFFFMETAVKTNPFQSDRFIWLDFGINHVARECDEIHKWILQVPDKIRQLCINPFLDHGEYRDIFRNIYHHTAGGIFTGSGENLLKYCDLFKKKTEEIYQQGWYQLEEAVMSIIERENPDLFDNFYGDYNGIICNYLNSIHDVHLVILGANKALNYNNPKLAFKMLNSCYKYFENNINDNMIYDFFLKHFIADYYNTGGSLLLEVIYLINQKIMKNDEHTIALIKNNKPNLNFYSNKHLIIGYD